MPESMVGFSQGSYEDYKKLYPTLASRPIDDTIYYLVDTDNHYHIILNGREYSASPTVYDEDGNIDETVLSLPIEFMPKSLYVDDPTVVDKPNTVVFLFERETGQ